MIDSVFKEISDFRDVEAINMFNEYLEQGLSEEQAILKISAVPETMQEYPCSGKMPLTADSRSKTMDRLLQRLYEV